MRQALLANGGVFIKLGQHVSSLLVCVSKFIVPHLYLNFLEVLPVEWRSAMRPLQDQCEATPYEELEHLFEEDLGSHPADLFEWFDQTPIGVASLAQVHLAKYRDNGAKVAVKVQHPHIAEFCEIDMSMVEFSLGASQTYLLALRLHLDQAGSSIGFPSLVLATASLLILTYWTPQSLPGWATRCARIFPCNSLFSIYFNYD